MSPTLEMRLRLALGCSKEDAAAGLATLEPIELDKLEELLDLYEPVGLRAADLDSEGVKYSAATNRRLILYQLETLTGIESGASGNAGAPATPTTTTPSLLSSEVWGDGV